RNTTATNPNDSCAARSGPWPRNVVNSEPTTAIPAAPDTCTTVLATPEAAPALSSGTPDNPMCTRIGATIPNPTPPSSSPGARCQGDRSSASPIVVTSTDIEPISSTVPTATSRRPALAAYCTATPEVIDNPTGQ